MYTQTAGLATRNNTGEMNQEQTGTDIGEVLQERKESVTLLRVNTDVMEAAGIQNGDVVAVDRSVTPANNNIVVASIDSEMVIRKLEVAGGKSMLVTPGRKLAPLDITGRFSVWGVVVCVIRNV